MQIAVDARELSGGRPASAAILAELLRAWDELPGALGHDFALCAASPVTTPPLPRLRVSHHVAPGGGPWWEQRSLPRLAAGARRAVRARLLGPALPGMPMVVTIHDVSFAAHPNGSRRAKAAPPPDDTRAAAWRARRVLTVSDFSKREIVRCFGTDASKIDVVYSGATPFAAARRRARRDGRPTTVLFVGSVFARRHVPELIDGFGGSPDCPRRDLEIVGDNRSRPRVDLDALVRAHGQDGACASALRQRCGAGRAVRGAAAFAFLSEYEGFGLTPLDALAPGVPIVVLDTEVAREIYGPAALSSPTPDPALVEAALDAASSTSHAPPVARRHAAGARALLMARIGAAHPADAPRRGERLHVPRLSHRAS
jgi:glycosyltransferase involved in cell wall biosynthesis